jgi:hypothetical protein
MFLGRPIEIAVFAVILGFLIGGISVAVMFDVTTTTRIRIDHQLNDAAR